MSLGLPLSNQLRTSGLFPPMVVHMVGIGEETGNVEEMLTNSAVYYEEEQKNLVQRLKSLIEPVMIILLAVIVGVILMAIFIPMFSMYSDIL